MKSMHTKMDLTQIYRWIEEQRMPQALGLELDDSVLPHHLALSIAKPLLCHEKALADCVCRSCTLLQEGTHPDVHLFLDKAVGIEDVRYVISLNSLSSILGQGRLICLVDAEHLNPNAANALLKILEEPNPKVYFLLFTHHFQGILPTIQSRLQWLSYRKSEKSFEQYWMELQQDEEASSFFQDFFAFLKQEKLPSELAQTVQKLGLLQGLEWLYVGFAALLSDSVVQKNEPLTPEGIYSRYRFEQYHASLEHIKEHMALVRKGSALQALLTVEAVLVPYIAL